MIDIKSFAKPKNNSSVNSVKGSSNIAGGSKNSGISTSEITGIVEGMLQGINIANGDNTLAITKNTSNNTISFTINSKTWTFDSKTGNLVYDGTVDVTNANFENITVTKAAHFFQLIIDEIKSTKGQILITAANAKLDKVTVRESDGDIFCYWKATDGNKTIYNQFAVDDQVICQTFNVGTSSEATQNKFYWYRVYSVGTETIDGELYNYIHLYANDKDPNSNAIPAVGDEIALLGNRTNADRQAAIIISAYNNQFLDSALQAPSIVQYDGINSYSLSNHRLNVISKGLNQFKGNFQTTAGDIQTQINNNKKTYFPILKPWYDYQNNLITDYKNDPLRYKGDLDIYSTPTYLEPGTYKVRVFINSSSLGSSYAICYHGNHYPDDLSSYKPIQGFTLSSTGKQIVAKDNTTLYEYAGEVTISENGYYGFNWWETLYMYVPEESNEFESNYSRITQTNNRITTEVGNINGQISTINQTAENIEAKVDNVSVKIDSGQITLNGNTKVQGDLTISDATNGFTLTNDDNYNTIIKPQSIGEYADYSNREQSEQIVITSNNAVLTTPNSQSSQKEPNAAQYFEVTYNNNNNNNNKYNLTANETLNLTAFGDFKLLVKGFTAYNRRNYSRYYFSGRDFTSPADYTPSTTSYNPKIYLRGYMYVKSNDFSTPDEVWNDALFYFHLYSIDTRLSIYNSSGTEVGYVTLSGNTPALNYTFTASSTDTYEIRSSVKIRFNAMFNNDDYNGVRRRMDYVFRDYVQTNYNISVTRYLQSNEISNIIGYDGISLSLGNDNLIYMGKDSTNIKYGKNELLVDSTGIKKYAGLTTQQYQNESTIGTDTGQSYYKSEYAPLNGCVVRFISDGGDYYLQPRDEVIVLVNPQSSSNFYLGTPSQNIGRKVYMKIYQGRGDAYINVYTTPNSTLSAFVNSDGRRSVSSITVNDRGVMFISIGDRWLTFISY